MNATGMTKPVLRILTYNIHKGFSAGNRRFVLHQIREALQTTGANILFLQEMQGAHTKHEQHHDNWPHCPPVEFLAQEHWPHMIYAKNVEHRLGHHGNALLSTFPFQHWENTNVSPFSWASRSLLHATIHIPGASRDLHIMCIHFGLTGIERRQQFDILVQYVNRHIPESSALIIAGDFNDWTGQAEKRLAHKLGLSEAFRTLHQHHARTWPAWMPMLTMDRIYFRGLTAVSCERPTQKIWKKLSDHAPLIASFTF